MNKKNFVIKISDIDYQIQGYEFKVDQIKKYSFVAHRAVGTNGKQVDRMWMVSHIESGLLLTGPWETKADAVMFAEIKLNNQTDATMAEQIRQRLKAI